MLHRYRAEVKSLTRTLEQLQKHGATLGVPLPGTIDDCDDDYDDDCDDYDGDGGALNKLQKHGAALGVP